MRRPTRLLPALLLPFLSLVVQPGPSPAQDQGPRRAEVVVYGGTAAGVIAAVAAAREGRSVLLIEPGQHVGGMVSGGLGATDTGNRRAIGGYSREFFRRIKDYYVRTYGHDSEQVRDCSDGFHFEPHVAEATFRALLKEAGVEVIPGARLAGVQKTGHRIETLRTANGSVFAANVFIDASYEGDLLAKAGVSYTVGREGREQYGETLAGVQARSPSHQWPLAISAFDGAGKLLPCIQDDTIEPAGTGDRKIQAYNFRLCMTDRPENRVPFPKPSGYDPSRYALLARYLAKRPDLTIRQLTNPVRMPNGKTDTNNNGPFSTDHIGANWDYPEADPKERERIEADHVAYTQGFFYFLANDPSVPQPLRDEMSCWGLAKDEFTDTGHWPHQLYVREARRMIGEYVMTEKDIMEDRTKADSVGVGSYNTDSHHVQRVATADGNVLNEGDFQVGVAPYAIPYRSLIPKAEECENLLVPVCVSASHVAYGTIRMEPVYMILGQACGVAASLAFEGKTTVQKVPVDRLTARLAEQKAVLSPEGLGGRPPVRRIAAKDLKGVVVDDLDALKTGDWSHSSAIGPFVGIGYSHDANMGKGTHRIRFTPELPEAGRFEVRLFATANPNRATNVPVIVHSADGEKTIRVDERKPRPEGEPIRLGVFRFEAGQVGWVEVRNDGTDGHVIADAVQWIPVP